MNVVDTKMATNFQLSQEKDYQVGIGHDRYDSLKATLQEKMGLCQKKMP